MINIFVLGAQVILSILDMLTFFLPLVTQLPYGIENSLTDLIGLYRGVTGVIPLAEKPIQMFTLALSVVFFVYAWGWVKYFIEVVRG